ncbi:hypothetical protein QCD79_18010 [Pseudomonas quasicaspiana]|nr:hypothetical protein [Pseudomonas quasicaspiana]
MEWSIPGTEIPVRQGDVLVSRDPRKGVIEAAFLVITADCDISKNKFGSQLAGLRMISYEQYLLDIWGAKKLKKTVSDEKEKLRGQVAKWHTKFVGADSSLTDDAVLSWLLRDGPQKIASALGIPSEKKFIRSLSMFHQGFSSLNEVDNLSDLQRYVKLRAAVEGEEADKILAATLAAAQKESLPDDTFFLPEMPEVENSGAIIMLREIVGLVADKICYKAPDATTKEHLLRVARLNPDVKYAVSQAFGSLYSKIGMSALYEQRCKAAISNVNGQGWRV